MLMRCAHGEVGEIADVSEVSERAGNADEQITIPCCNDEIGMTEYILHDRAIVHGTPFAQCRGVVWLDLSLTPLFAAWNH
jgi:hypothetical protein